MRKSPGTARETISQAPELETPSTPSEYRGDGNEDLGAEIMFRGMERELARLRALPDQATPRQAAKPAAE